MSPRMPSRCGLIAQQSMPRSEFQTPFFSSLLDLLHQARERGLVQFGENVRKVPAFVCNCCGCCCEALVAQRRFGFLKPVHTTGFVPEIARDSCIGCARCVTACPVEAMALVSANDPTAPKKRTVRLEEAACLGCG